MKDENNRNENTPQAPATPNLDRMTQVRDEWNTIEAWMEWLTERGYRLGGFKYHSIVCRRHCYGEEDEKKPCCCEEVAAECWGVNADPGDLQ